MAIVGGCLVAAVASPAAGGAIAGTASIALATAFVIGQRSQRKEREAKARISAEMQRGVARVEDDQLTPPTPEAGPA
jgi:hypothetical protein